MLDIKIYIFSLCNLTLLQILCPKPFDIVQVLLLLTQSSVSQFRALGALILQLGWSREALANCESQLEGSVNLPNTKSATQKKVGFLVSF